VWWVTFCGDSQRTTDFDGVVSTQPHYRSKFWVRHKTKNKASETLVQNENKRRYVERIATNVSTVRRNVEAYVKKEEQTRADKKRELSFDYADETHGGWTNSVRRLQIQGRFQTRHGGSDVRATC
jgi:hypothetical protein